MRSDVVIPISVLGGDDTDVLRCVVVLMMNNGSRGRYSIDLNHGDVDDLPILSESEGRDLLMELVEYVPPIPLANEQEAAWKRHGYDWGQRT